MSTVHLKYQVAKEFDGPVQTHVAGSHLEKLTLVSQGGKKPLQTITIHFAFLLEPKYYRKMSKL